MKRKLTYYQVGDNYDTKDPVKKLAQKLAKTTSLNIKNLKYQEIASTRGESAFVLSPEGIVNAPSITTVVESLGVKNLVADEMRKITGKTYYDIVAYDTVASVVNDLVTVGARPLVVSAFWAIEHNKWLRDEKRLNDLMNGWKRAVDDAGAVWGGGETPTLRGLLRPGVVDLGGSATGLIFNKQNLITDSKLESGDRIVFIKSSGVNTNGISLVRALAKKLEERYATKLKNGKFFGEVVLTKSNIYAKFVGALLDKGVDIHYISNITGHGLRKVMRARPQFTYVIEKVFKPDEIFQFIQEKTKLSDQQMYQTFNMGQDYAIFVDKKDINKIKNTAAKFKFTSLDAGYIESGKRQTVIKPKNITFSSATLDLR